MKYIFLATNKAFTEASVELQNCGVLLQETLLFHIKPVPEGWSLDHLTKKAYNDVYLNKATFDDDLNLERLQRLYNLIEIFNYIMKNDIGDCIIIENIRDFCRMFSTSIKTVVDTYIVNNKNTDILFLDESHQINYSHYKYFGDFFKQNEYVYKKCVAFYINQNFVKKFLETQSIFYKPFEYTLNGYMNESVIITFFTNKDNSDLDDYYTYRNTVMINSGKILLSILFLGASIMLYKRYKAN